MSASQDQVQSQSISPKPSSIGLVPYAMVDGRWTLPDEFLLSLAVQMRDEDRFRKVFYDGRVKSPDDLVTYFQKSSNLSIFFFDGLEPLGFAWLNDIHVNRAFAHFCGLNASRGRTQEIGRLALDYWMSTFEFIDVILGLIAKNNPLAIRYVEQIGFTVLGEIPNVIFDAYEGDKVSGVLSYYVR